jgi:acyl-CoA synthetase (AMP-forming)/AMP-acid ligase II
MACSPKIRGSVDIYLHQLLEDAAARNPEKEAVIYRDQSISYLDLERKSNKLAQLLIRNGVKPGDRVGILLGKCLESIISIFGILKTGGCYVPIDPSAPATRVTQSSGIAAS